MLRKGGFIPFAAPSTAVFTAVGWVDKPSISAAHAGFPLKLQPSLLIVNYYREYRDE
jgi:hypothetical protein